MIKLLRKPITKKDIANLKKSFGNYLKITVDLEKETLTAGDELHADGEKMLLNNGSQSKNIWGGGINLKNKKIDTTAVLNIRPNLDNESMEILDSKKRNKFVKIVESIFSVLWD